MPRDACRSRRKVCAVVKGGWLRPRCGWRCAGFVGYLLRISFAVATVKRGAGSAGRLAVKAPVLILGYAWPEDYEELIENGRPVHRLQREGRRRSWRSWGRRHREDLHMIHIKVDTGMHRIGFPVDRRMRRRRCAGSGRCTVLWWKGIFTHFARADEDGIRLTPMQQLRRIPGLYPPGGEGR